jgi:hypothetical protein
MKTPSVMRDYVAPHCRRARTYCRGPILGLPMGGTCFSDILVIHNFWIIRQERTHLFSLCKAGRSPCGHVLLPGVNGLLSSHHPLCRTATRWAGIRFAPYQEPRCVFELKQAADSGGLNLKIFEDSASPAESSARITRVSGVRRFDPTLSTNVANWRYVPCIPKI